VCQLAEASSDSLMQGLAHIKSLTLLQHGGCGPDYSLQQVVDAYQAAKVSKDRPHSDILKTVGHTACHIQELAVCLALSWL